jgi:hypothetical protein
MGKRPPRKLNAAAIEHCANIVCIERRDIFDPALAKLVGGACRWGKATSQQIKTRRARAEIVRAGRIFAAALRNAPLNAKWELEIVLPYGTTFLNLILDEMGPSTRPDNAKRFVVLLCAFVETAGGDLTHNEKENRGTLVKLLEALKPYLPVGFVPASPDVLRRLKENAANLLLHTRQ